MTNRKEVPAPARVTAPLLLGIVAVGAVAFALGYGAGSHELARLGTPSGVALYAAQLGLVAPARAAEPVADVAYLPAILHADAPAIEQLPPQY
jgi:hypothetical protein